MMHDLETPDIERILSEHRAICPVCSPENPCHEAVQFTDELARRRVSVDTLTVAAAMAMFGFVQRGGARKG
jgi:hypothetical protein